ncbi:MAG: zinc ribbon domain-containing protein [Atopobiaceae bacterium]|nr:zinc ribbon domain-containing protein [Atopobiaceae bacterium]
MGQKTIEVRKCPTCSGAVHYDAHTGALTCAWCGNVYEAQDLQISRIDATPSGYLCPECGATLVMDDFVAATSCPYCGNHEIVPHRLEEEFEPEFVIPFGITKTQAVQRYEEFIKDKQYLPEGFAEKSSIVSMQGTYVPFWLKDGVVDFDFTFVSSHERGKNISYGDHRRAGTYAYERIPADSSARMPDDMMDSLEPYDYGKFEPFSTDCLPGFVAEHFTVKGEDVNGRVDFRAKNTAVLACRQTILDDYWTSTSVDSKRSCATVRHTRSTQALLPVWLFVTKFEDKGYLVGVNGQTGKVAVNLPIDQAKQNRSARKEGLISVLISLPGTVLLVFLGMVIMPKEGLGNMVLSIGFVLLGLALPIAFYLYDTKVKSRQVKQSMHNVREAGHALDYDKGGLSLTISAPEKGPVHHQNNWPE